MDNTWIKQVYSKSIFFKWKVRPFYDIFHTVWITKNLNLQDKSNLSCCDKITVLAFSYWNAMEIDEHCRNFTIISNCRWFFGKFWCVSARKFRMCLGCWNCSEGQMKCCNAWLESLRKNWDKKQWFLNYNIW